MTMTTDGCYSNEVPLQRVDAVKRVGDSSTSALPEPLNAGPGGMCSTKMLQEQQLRVRCATNLWG